MKAKTKVRKVTKVKKPRAAVKVNTTTKLYSDLKKAGFKLPHGYELKRRKRK